MPKTIAITPSWYWPEGIDRVAGVPPFTLNELCIDRHARRQPDAVAIAAPDGQLTYGELQAHAGDAGERLAAQAGLVRLTSALSLENVVSLFGALKAGLQVDLQEEGANQESTLESAADGPALRAPAITIPGQGGPVCHSQRSLLAMAISVSTFLDAANDGGWLSSLPLHRWDGLSALLTPLYLGCPLAICRAGDTDSLLEAIIERKPAYAAVDLDEAFRSTRESRWGIRKARDIVQLMLLGTSGPFDPSSRQRIGKSFRTNALTVFGLPETGPVFASHPQWYLDESVGIPVTNAHVVPSDPRNGTPIQTLWELVESAEVTVKGPMLSCITESSRTMDDGRFRTGVIASSDANGMIYLLPD